jgi:hypothetical protein
VSLFILTQLGQWDHGPGHWGGGGFFPLFFLLPWFAFVAGALLVFVVMRLSSPR